MTATQIAISFLAWSGVVGIASLLGFGLMAAVDMFLGDW